MRTSLREWLLLNIVYVHVAYLSFVNSHFPTTQSFATIRRKSLATLTLLIA